MSRAPDPSSLELVEASTQTLHLVALVVGEGVGAVLEAARPRAAGEPIEDGGLRYLPLKLGELRGWHTWLHLYGFGDDAHLTPLIQRYAARANGIVVAEPAEAPAGEAVKAVAAAVAKTGQKTPVAVFGGKALAHKWSALADYEPVHVAEGGAPEVLAALKALSAHMLARARGP
jgi:hypothetical protein